MLKCAPTRTVRRGPFERGPLERATDDVTLSPVLTRNGFGFAQHQVSHVPLRELRGKIGYLTNP
jgi:hypothetical protein